MQTTSNKGEKDIQSPLYAFALHVSAWIEMIETNRGTMMLMKKVLTIVALFTALVKSVSAQQYSVLPRLAVVEFSVNLSTEKVRADATIVRNLTESLMVASGKYQSWTKRSYRD